MDNCMLDFIESHFVTFHNYISYTIFDNIFI
jgi:hypothetical protein